MLECKRDFHLATLYHGAVSQIKNNNLKDAQRQLNAARERCELLPFISHYYYVKAYIAQVNNQEKDKKELLESFILFSESIYPTSFYQEDFIMTEPMDIYHKYKLAAREALKNNTKIDLVLTKDKKYEVARYNSYYKSLMPGFRNDAPSIGILSPEFNWRFGLGLSAAYQFNSKKYGEFIPAALVNKYYNLKYLFYRKSVYQNSSRRHQMGIALSAFEWKDVDLDYSNWGRVEDVDIKDSGVGYSVGLGGTFQLNNFWNFMYQGKIVNEKEETNFKSTALLGATLMEEFIVQIGTLEGNSVVAVKRRNLYYILDFSNRGFIVSMLTGFGF